MRVYGSRWEQEGESAGRERWEEGGETLMSCPCELLGALTTDER